MPSYSVTNKTYKTRVVIVDTNVLLHNIDVLEHPSFALSNIVICQTALLECRHRSFTTYGRVMDLLRSSCANNANNTNTAITGSTGNSNNNSNSSSPKKRCVIFFPDVHHVATQFNNNVDAKTKTINDENDAKIRQVALHYGEALAGGGVEVILLSDDKGCRDLAMKEQEEILLDDDDGSGNDNNHQEDDNSDTDKKSNSFKFLYAAQSVREHVSLLEKDDPNLSLSDVVAQFSAAPNTASSTSVRKGAKKLYYRAHLPQDELSVGTKAGKYYQGTIRAERGTHDRCYVTVRQGEDRVAVSIIGEQDINRAVDGDVVVIELHPVDKWIGGEEESTERKVNNKQNNVGIAEETAEPSIRDETNVTDVIGVPGTNTDSSADNESTTAFKRPTGKIVGIMRRNFRKNYCGSIHSVTGVKAQQGGGKEIDEVSKPSKRDETANEFETEHPDGTITCVFYAVDARIPPVLVRTTQRDRLIGKRILIAIDSWPSNSKFPLGHYVKTIGDTGLKDVETEVLLHEHNIPCEPFPAKVRVLYIHFLN